MKKDEYGLLCLLQVLGNDAGATQDDRIRAKFWPTFS